jgi:hypothetical protein
MQQLLRHLLELLQCNLVPHFADGGRDEGTVGDSLSCMVCGLKSFGVLCSSSCAVDRPKLYDFRAQYFLISWVNSLLLIKNSGKHKLSPPVKKKENLERLTDQNEQFDTPRGPIW